MTDGPLFAKVLVANRGEIAIRIFRTLRELGIGSVAVYSDADRSALHITYADEAYCIGGELPADSYLRGDVILDVAVRAGAQAIHPGYGFLAESAVFARQCAERGIVFIGPTPDAIERMGTKTGSRQLMEAAGVPIVPGSVEPLESFEAARSVAEDIGYPIAVKARSGGGGRGFRVALTADELEDAYSGAAREGERYFSDGAIYMERYLPDPRHIEAQILADDHGTVLFLGERDCTIQRRHQKLLEESPSPVLDDAGRARLAKMAVDAARAVGYRNAGTIECLLDADGTPFFLEMNTRVQVEHTVTEMVTGMDIVAEQLRIAAGLPVSVTQDEIRPTGHAIEVRINAEDALTDFRPCSGTISTWHEPSGIGVRVDSGVTAGSVVSPNYDNLLAKLIVHAPTREAATARLARALDEFSVEGVDTLIGFHRALLDTPEFVAGGSCRDAVADPAAIMGDAGTVAAAVTADDSATDDAGTLVPSRAWDLEVDGRRFHVQLLEPNATSAVTRHLLQRRRHSAQDSSGRVLAPIPGNVVQIAVSKGQVVHAGQLLCVLEAMKMENEIAAPADGTVSHIAVQPGTVVDAGTVLVTLE